MNMEIKMDPELKQKWLKALRSGRYKQVKGTLHNENGYCCLGVLASVSKMGRWEELSYSTTGGKRYKFVPFKKYTDKFDDAVPYVGTFDEGSETAFGLDVDQQTTLVNMNDSNNKSFKQIADYVEREL